MNSGTDYRAELVRRLRAHAQIEDRIHQADLHQAANEIESLAKMAWNMKIELTEDQKTTATQIMLDVFGAHIQTGRYAGHDDWVYVAWQFSGTRGTHFAYISPDGTIHYESV